MVKKATVTTVKEFVNEHVSSKDGDDGVGIARLILGLGRSSHRLTHLLRSVPWQLHCLSVFFKIRTAGWGRAHGWLRQGLAEARIDGQLRSQRLQHWRSPDLGPSVTNARWQRVEERAYPRVINKHALRTIDLVKLQDGSRVLVFVTTVPPLGIFVAQASIFSLGQGIKALEDRVKGRGESEDQNVTRCCMSWRCRIQFGPRCLPRAPEYSEKFGFVRAAGSRARFDDSRHPPFSLKVSQKETMESRQLLHLTAKVRLANRMLRGKGLRKTMPGRTLGWVRADGQRQASVKKRAGPAAPGRKLQSRRQTKHCLGWRWWQSLDAESRAIYLLYLLCLAVGLQVYNAYENLDDQLLVYDVEQLEKTLHQELVGQTLAINRLSGLLRDYLATYIHPQAPLFLSIHGPAGVGKSHVARLIAKHFSFQLGPGLVLQHSAKYQQLLPGSLGLSGLATRVSEVLSRSLDAQRVPVLLFDEMELASPGLLSLLGGLLGSNRTAGAIYIVVSRLGQERIVQSFRSWPGGAHHRFRRLDRELQALIGRLHPVWQRRPHVIPLGPLDRAHVVSCFEQLMDREGLYPQRHRAEALANKLSYYRASQRLYAQQGCKQAPAMVRHLAQEAELERLRKGVSPWGQPQKGLDVPEVLPMLNGSTVHS
ncbi:uncharacterized protein LOC125467690 [Stegostoma tigrinum]|uniref:uncharacterized protein LOC125467690 n=1 Tax=Stegostoma tigrinum TaxID=3053191 RepID=UPI0028703914|nr:uncharacterized protein LOC125467690 [Stegostoma tigrinum]